MRKSRFLLTVLSTALILTGCAKSQSTHSTDKLADGNPLPTPTASYREQITTDKNGTTQAVTPISVPVARTVKEDIYINQFDANPEVVRYGRYTLVSSRPDGGQKYLLEQLVTINIPGSSRSPRNVRQGIEYTLRDTGFSLCYPTDENVQRLFNLDLPKVHYKFGSMKLRDALQMLAGEAYILTVNDALREVCYESRTSIPEPAKVNVKVEANKGDYEREFDTRNY